jgi:hypothetical protein
METAREIAVWCDWVVRVYRPIWDRVGNPKIGLSANAVIRSVETALGPLSSHLVAIGMLWVAMGALIGLILAVLIPLRLDNAEIAN